MGKLLYQDGIFVLIMRYKLTIILFFCACLVWAQNDSTALQPEKQRIFQGCGGGMMVHAGYLFGQPTAATLPSGENISPQGLTYGLGGSMRVHLWKHLRIGGEGFVSTMNSGTTDMKHVLQEGSYIRTGWGGVVADACWRKEKVWPYIGGSIGGGAMRSLYVLNGNQNDWMAENEAYLHKQSFFYVNPYVGVDWCLTQKVHMTFRVDWMMALHKGDLVMPTGPRLLVGFMFCH